MRNTLLGCEPRYEWIHFGCLLCTARNRHERSDPQAIAEGLIAHLLVGSAASQNQIMVVWSKQRCLSNICSLRYTDKSASMDDFVVQVPAEVTRCVDVHGLAFHSKPGKRRPE